MDRSRLGDAEIQRRLQDLSGWSLEGGRLSRDLKFSSFADAFAFMTRCSFEIEKLDHHPEWTNTYRTLTISLSTHDAGGVTALDFELASRMNDILARLTTA